MIDPIAELGGLPMVHSVERMTGGDRVIYRVEVERGKGLWFQDLADSMGYDIIDSSALGWFRPHKYWVSPADPEFDIGGRDR